MQDFYLVCSVEFSFLFRFFQCQDNKITICYSLMIFLTLLKTDIKYFVWKIVWTETSIIFFKHFGYQGLGTAINKFIIRAVCWGPTINTIRNWAAHVFVYGSHHFLATPTAIHSILYNYFNVFHFFTFFLSFHYFI